jgi:hypothetical protein
MKEPQFFVLTVVIPIEDNFDTVIRLLRFSSYEKEYQPSMTSIHKMVYRFGPLTEDGVENYKTAFREIFSNSPFKNHCSFTVAEITQ